MEHNINLAIKLYSGDKAVGLFVDKLYKNLKKMNDIYDEIKELFENARIEDFKQLPEDRMIIAKFASLFKEFTSHLEAAKIQGFVWKQMSYEFTDSETGENNVIEMHLNENIYLALVQRYKEIPRGDTIKDSNDIPYDLVGYITEIDTEKIDADYMNSRFKKYLKELQKGSSPEAVEQALSELHKSFAVLNQEDQKYANIFLHDVQSGNIFIEDNKSLRDYINEYQYKAKDDQVHQFSDIFGLDENKLRNMMSLKLTNTNINEFGRLDELKKTIDKVKAKSFFEIKDGIKLNPPKVNIKIDRLLREFILSGGFEIE
nr:hypothetical protein [Fusobacterium sp. PH5-7]